MANTKLKKKKKGVIGVNGFNNDAGNTQVVCDISGRRTDQLKCRLSLGVLLTESAVLHF